jgi:putative transposase
MILVQKNKLYLSEEDKDIIDKLSFHSARLYNSCVYNIRQYYFNNNKFLPFKEQYHLIKGNENFKLLINDSSQQVLRMVDKNFKSFFSLLRLKQKGKYSNDINIPKYLKKTKGWSIFVQGRSCRIKGDKVYIGLSKLFREQYNIDKKDLIFSLPKHLKDIKSLQQIQIVPLYGGNEYDIIFCYENKNDIKKLNKDKFIGIDCGLDNLLTCYNPDKGESFIIDGKKIKSINQNFNKKKGHLQSEYERNGIKDINTKKFIKLSEKRKNFINNYFNQTINLIINYCLNEKIGNIIIGDFKGVKQEINLGSKTNQNFVSIPYGVLKRKLEAKCQYYGINYVLQEESYTSKCSSLDLENVEKQECYLGKRTKRGLFKTKEGIVINADVNGACNIIRKYFKSMLGYDLSYTGVSGVVNHPIRIYPLKPNEFIRW